MSYTQELLPLHLKSVIATVLLNNTININELRKGNHKVYEMLFTQWYTPLCNYAYSILHDADEAKDMVQKTFYKLWDQRAEIEIHTSVKSYLYRIVHNDCLNKIKQQKTRTEHNQYIAYNHTNSYSNTDSVVMQNELEKKIETAIKNLPERCREVFKLSRMQQLSYAEIAKELNITTNTVETQIVKALRALRTELKEYLPILLILLVINSK